MFFAHKDITGNKKSILLSESSQTVLKEEREGAYRPLRGEKMIFRKDKRALGRLEERYGSAG